jgi:hypothetical protein
MVISNLELKNSILEPNDGLKHDVGVPINCYFFCKKSSTFSSGLCSKRQVSPRVHDSACCCSLCPPGAFLIPYFCAVLTCGLPIFVLEIALGQYFGLGNVQVIEKIAPIMKGWCEVPP